MSYKCGKCGATYEGQGVYETDTWNVGHYGCTMSNAPMIRVGTRDTGCPQCRKIEMEKLRRAAQEKQEAEKRKPKLVRTYVKDGMRYSLYAEPIAQDIAPLSKNNGTLNLDEVDIELPKETVYQLRYIRSIEKCLSVKYNGNSITDAQEFIAEHVEEFTRAQYCEEENETIAQNVYELY